MSETIVYVPENQCELWLLTPGFDDLLLTGETQSPSQFEIQAMADEATWGNPVPVDVSVQRWMTDGAVASTQGVDNREIAFTLRVRADSSVDLAAAEAELALRANRPCLLKWRSLDGYPDAPATMFKVWTWHLAHNLSLDDEATLTRMYAVTMTAAPWVHSEFLTTLSPVPTSIAPTVVSIDTCASTTNWVGSPSAVTTSGGSLRVDRTENRGGPFVRGLARTASATGLGSTPYLALDMTLAGGKVSAWIVKVGADASSAVILSKVGQIGTVFYYALPTGTTSFGYLEVDSLGNVPNGGAFGTGGTVNVRLQLNDVSATSSIGASGFGTGMQQTRSLAIGGSVPTSGSILVASPNSTGLGSVLFATRTEDGSGLTPPMRQYRTSGPTTPVTDLTAVSGKRESFMTGGLPTGLLTFTPPVPVREATYAVVGRFRSSAAGSIQVVVNAGVGAQVAVGSVIGQVTFAAANVWTLGVVGAISLPAQRLPAQSTLSSFISLTGLNGGTANVDLDEFWLLDITNGDVSMVECGTATRLWIDSPDVAADSLPGLYIGTQDDRSDAFQVQATSTLAPIGDHDLDPRGTVAFTLAAGVSGALVSFSAYRAWLGNAAA